MKALTKILLADRSRNMREFLQRELEADRYQVQTAGDGREIMMMINTMESPDLLIMDIDLPLVDGLEILEKVHNRIPPLPVVIYSLFTELLDHPAVAFAEAFVEKSEDLEQLKRAITEVLQRS